MTKQDWVIRIEGVNLAETVFNTNDLSTIRGSSLVLEAFPHELRYWLMQPSTVHPGAGCTVLCHGGAVCALEVKDCDEAEIETFAEKIRNELRAPYNANKGEPPFLDWRKIQDFSNIPAPQVLHYLRTPSEHMTFVVDVAPVGPGQGIEPALNRAHQKNRRRQMRAPNLPRAPLETAGSDAIGERAMVRCPVDPAQQAPLDGAGDRATVWARRGQFSARYDTNDPDATTNLRNFRMSVRSADLRTYGRDARRTLYPVALGGSQTKKLYDAGLFRTHDLAQSFQDIVGSAPAGLPRSLPGKLAFVYFDGNDFTEKRAENNQAQKDRAKNDPGAFARAVEAARCAALDNLLHHFLAEPISNVRTYRRRIIVREPGTGAGGKPRMVAEARELLRMETLIAGGDEFSLVLPAWLAWELTWAMLGWLAEAGAKAARDEKLAGVDDLSYRAGLLICDAKTPARRATAFANALAEDAKAAYEDAEPQPALSCHIVESHDVPDLPEDGGIALGAVRETRYRVPADGVPPEKRDYYGAPFRFVEETRAPFERDMRFLKAAVARSQIYELIRTGDTDFEAAARRMAQRGRSRASEADILAALRGGDRLDRPMRLRQVAELWDYFEPLSELVSEPVA